ncbi:MAG: P1 family peptidase [Acidobacteria bacterium]|nr:P1 family peptidase [Acidobacteriota bacterium]MCI0723470.1 P1 family peptidase [Acidobacteriota bacterium]
MRTYANFQTRREFLAGAGGITAFAGALIPSQWLAWSSLGALADSGCLTDIEGIKVGHYTETRRPTGCTVILTEGGAVAGVDVRGSAPGTRETDLLSPLNTVEKIHALVLSGGSAFGLETAAGVMQHLEEQKVGYETRVAKIPIVPAAILFDLGLGDARIRPDKRSGYLACKAAKARACEEGNVGAGAGATVGKLFGMDRAMKGGLGTASIQVGPVRVGALVAVNAFGDVLDPATGIILAGARTPDGKSLVNSIEQLRQGRYAAPKASGENTTIGVVATNVALNKSQAAKMAQMAHDGLARTINPVHTPLDGDTLFAISTGTTTVAANLTLLGSLAADVVSQAVCRAVLRAKGLPGLPSHHDLAAPTKRG